MAVSTHSLTYVHGVTDSTFENLYWLMNGDGTNLKEAIENSVEGQIERQLGSSFQYISHGYDGFTTENVLGGGVIGSVFPWGGPKVNAYIRSKLSSDRSPVVRPLESLSRSISEAPAGTTHYVIISVGGNDFRVHLRNPIKLLTEVPNVQRRYLEILDRVQRMGRNIRPILVFQYRTDANNDSYGIYKVLGFAAVLPLVCIGGILAASLLRVTGKIGRVSSGAFSMLASIAVYAMTRVIPWKVTLGILKGQSPGMTMIGALMEKFYQPMLERAVRDHLPILDLPNSFNPYDRLYISGIEPNVRAGELIAQGITTIIKGSNLGACHSYEVGGIYRCNGGRQFIPRHWQVEYPSKRV
jgi:hypothetical protein